MGYSVEGKKVLVTGGSSGIGAALAEGFAERGAVVGICARRADRLAEVLERCRKHSPESRSWVVDLAELDAVAGFAATADQELGGIDVLVNNAGIPKRRDVTRLTPEVVESMMTLNYFSPIRLTLALLPGLIERGRPDREHLVGGGAPRSAGRGRVHGDQGRADRVHRVDGGRPARRTDVLVHLVNPGVIDTELFHLPDNDEGFHSAVEALPVEAIVQPVIDQLDSGAFEIYVPEWFQDISAGKFANPNAFIEGTKEYARSERVTPVSSPRSSPVRRGVQSRRSGCSAHDLLVQRLEAEVARRCASRPATRSRRAMSASMCTGVPAASAISWAWHERSIVMNHQTASSTECPTVSRPWLRRIDGLDVAERVGDALALLGVEDDAGVVVEHGVVLVERADVLGQRVEEPAERRPRLAVDRVRVRGRDHVGPRGVDLRVDRERGAVDHGVALDDLALVVRRGSGRRPGCG